MFCPLMQKGTNANNVKNIFFIIVGFYRLPPTLLELLPELLVPELYPLLLEELLLDLLILEELLLEELLLDLLMLEELLLEELLLGLLTLVLLLLLLLGLTDVEFLLDEELGLTYSELERTCLSLLAGV